MKICAIIAEFNPFHNGHAYLIDKVRSCGYTHVIVVMSGNFVQRGEPAIISKEIRAKIALNSGANLVIELPTVKTTLTAEKYAFSAIELISHIRRVDTLVFGSESGSIKDLNNIKNYIYSNNIFDEKLKNYLSSGMTFAKAREKSIYDISGNCDISSAIKTPNNILGVEYLKAIDKINMSIECLTFERTKNLDNIKSATEIRNMIINNDPNYKKYITYNSYKEISNAIKEKLAPVNMLFMDRVIISKLRGLTLEEISKLPDISEGLENRIYNSIKESCSLEELLFKIKTKRYTMSRIKRIILNAFLGINSEMTLKPIEYIKILATDSKGLEILKKMKNSTSVPILTRYSELNNMSNEAKIFFEMESSFTDIYNTLTPQILPCEMEKKFRLIKG